MFSHQISIHTCIRQICPYYRVIFESTTDVVLSKLNTFTNVILLAFKHLINSQ